MVSDCHELGQGWIPEDGIVRQADVRDVEVDELGAVILALPEGDRQADLPYRCGGTIGYSGEKVWWAGAIHMALGGCRTCRWIGH